MSDVIHIHTSEPTKPARSVRELGKHLGLDFAAGNLPLSMVALARKVEELEFQIELLRFELRQPLWKRAIDKLKGSGER
jgi:hypothetical protein